MASPGSTLLVIGELATVKADCICPRGPRRRDHPRSECHRRNVDSLPQAKPSPASVKHIADKAEFTPRNVQTVDGRRTTVYAIEIDVPNPDFKLKPGMPADVVFK